MSVAIKLFGKTILQSNVNFSSSDSTKGTTCSLSTSIQLQQQQQFLSNEQQRQNPLLNGAFIKQENGGICDNPKTPSVDQEAKALQFPTNGVQSDTSNNSTQERALKNKDKIIPCPRCHSMDTKFCYFNNYSVNQPRHFCKKCQRYWTDGGVMRSVPVGAGRRKNKPPSVLHGEQLLIDEAAISLQPRVSLGSNNALISELMASNSNSADRKLSSQSSGTLARNETPDDGSSNSPSMVSKRIQTGLNDNLQKIQSYYPLQPPGFSTPPWMPVSCPPGFHAPFSQHSTYPPSCPTFPGCWSTLLISSNNTSSQTLGKHSRDKKSESAVLIPKTLRLSEPSEAAMSSMWATRGLIKNDEKNSSKNVIGLFNDLRSTGHHDQPENRATGPVSVLHANPAAMSRSQSFHETT